MGVPKEMGGLSGQLPGGEIPKSKTQCVHCEQWSSGDSCTQCGASLRNQKLREMYLGRPGMKEKYR